LTVQNTRWLLLCMILLVVAVPIIASLETQRVTTPSQPLHTATSAALTYPPGNRVVRIRPLDPNSTWILPGYTATDALNWLSDLKPTTLNRYTTGTQYPNATVPVGPGQPTMTVSQFLQASLNAMGPNPVIFPRISFKDYATSPVLFMSEAQTLYSMYSQLSPKQTLLSLDNTNTYFANHTVADAQVLESQLLAIGWTGVAWGACAATNQLPNGTTFAMICVTPPKWEPDYATMSALQTQQPSIQEFEAQIDFPGVMTTFANMTPDQQATAITNLAENQSTHGYHFMYPVMQLKSGSTTNTFAWDSTKVVTSTTGPYQGESLYQVMKNLMNTYNAVGPAKPDFQMSATQNIISFTAGKSSNTTISINPIAGFASSVTLTAPPSTPTGLSVNCSTSTVNAGGASTCTLTSSTLGSYTQSIVATSGNLTHSMILSATVISATAPNFSLQASTLSTTSLARTNSSTTLTVTPLNGFTNAVSLTATPNSTSLSCALTSSKISHGSGTTVLSCTSSAASNYLATVTATNGPLVQSVTLVFHTQDFTISPNIRTLNLAPGSSASTTITITNLNGFSGTITLTGTSTPSGPRVSFNPTTLTSSGKTLTSTMTVSSSGGSTVANGNFSINVTATSGTLSHSTTLQTSVSSSHSPLVDPVMVPILVIGGGAVAGMAIASGAVLVRRRHFK